MDGLLYAAFYVLTALAAIAYYRRRIFTNARDALLVGLLPVAATAFLAWIGVRVGANRNRAGALVADRHRRGGRGPHARARFILRSSFFQTPRESAPRS